MKFLLLLFSLNLITPLAIQSQHPGKAVKEIVFEGLRRPWSIAFLAAEEALVAEKEGDLVRINLSTKSKVKIKGFPSDLVNDIGAIHCGDNAGIFEVLLDPNFDHNRFVYVSYAARGEQGTTTKVVRGILENDSLVRVKTLFVELHLRLSGFTTAAEWRSVVTANCT